MSAQDVCRANIDGERKGEKKEALTWSGYGTDMEQVESTRLRTWHRVMAHDVKEVFLLKSAIVHPFAFCAPIFRDLYMSQF